MRAVRNCRCRHTEKSQIKCEGGRILENSDIIELLTKRNENALEIIDLRFRKSLKSIIGNIVRNEEDVQECLNDVYMRVWNSIPPAKPDNFKAYISVIARNIAIDRYKSQNRKSDISKEALDEADDNLADVPAPERTDEIVEKQLKEQKIRDLLTEYTRRLPPKDQKICIARFFYDAKIREIARRLDMPTGTVKSALNRIKKGIADYLREEGIDNE